MRVKLRDIAALANVSVATASYVMNDKWGEKGISPETAERVTRLAEEHGFVPNRTAALLKKGRYHLIALISPHCADFYADLLQGIEEEGEKHDYQILFCSTFDRPDREEAYVKSLVARRVDGVIILPIESEAPHLKFLTRNRVPTVFFRRQAGAKARGKFMTFNDFEGGRMAAQHLIARGCKRIAFGTSSYLQDFEYLRIIEEARLQGCREAMREAGLATAGLDPILMEEDAPGAAARFASRVHETAIDGIVGFSDHAAIAMMNMLRSEGMSIPEDVRFIGFDDTEMGRLHWPALSSISLPKADLGKTMMEAIESMLERGSQDTDEMLLSPRVVSRASTA